MAQSIKQVALFSYVCVFLFSLWDGMKYVTNEESHKIQILIGQSALIKNYSKRDGILHIRKKET